MALVLIQINVIFLKSFFKKNDSTIPVKYFVSPPYYHPFLLSKPYVKPGVHAATLNAFSRALNDFNCGGVT